LLFVAFLNRDTAVVIATAVAVTVDVDVAVAVAVAVTAVVVDTAPIAAADSKATTGASKRPFAVSKRSAGVKKG